MKLAFSAAVVLLGLVASPASEACINGVELEIERFHGTPAGQVAIAEDQLAHDHPISAAARVREQFPQIRVLDAKAPPLGRRAVRLYALAIVRSQGTVDASVGWTPWANYEWALETLRELEASTPNNPARQAELAEAEIALSRTRADGVRTIENLDGRDLLGSAHAYLALARARQAEGDEGGTLAAVRRCTMMSSDRRRCEKPTPGKT